MQVYYREFFYLPLQDVYYKKKRSIFVQRKYIETSVYTRRQDDIFENNRGVEGPLRTRRSE